MTARALAWLLLAPCTLLGQLRLYLVEAEAERLIVGTHDLGALEIGQRREVSFRVRNVGLLPAPLETLSVSGTAFSLGGPAPPPRVLDPGFALYFSVRFEPALPGQYSAFLSLNSQTVLLRAVAVPAPVLCLERDGACSLLDPATSIDFGPVARGSTSLRRFWLANPSNDRLAVTLTVLWSSFKGPLGLDSPLSLAPAQTVAFDVIFEPQTVGADTGWLKINQRSFRLQGTGLSSFPKLLLWFDPPEVASGRTLWLTVRLTAPAPEDCRGVAGLDFRSYLPSQPDDPAIAFLAGGTSRWETLEVSQGEDTARFGSERGVWLQTGTTAGRIGITVKLCGQEAWAGLEPKPAPVVIDSLKVTRANGNLEVSLTGFDNTRSASQVAFSFFDPAGQLVAPGRIALDAAAEFQNFYESSKLGGTFTLRAAFPVTGDASAIAAVEVEITNSVGVTRSERTPVRP